MPQMVAQKIIKIILNMNNLIIYENIDALLVYSALEQFTDSPVFQTSFPLEPDFEAPDFFFDTSFFDYNLMLDNIQAYFACIESNVHPWSVDPLTLSEEKSALIFLLEFFQQELNDINNFFEHDPLYRHFQDTVFIPDRVLSFANLDNENSAYHLLRDVNQMAVTEFENGIYKYQSYAPYAAECMLYKLNSGNIVSAYDVTKLISEGLTTKDAKFYEAIHNDIEATLMDIFSGVDSVDYMDEFTLIYKRAIEKMDEFSIPYNLAFGLAFKEVIASTMFNYLIWDISPESLNFNNEVKNEAGCDSCGGNLDDLDDFSDYFFFTSVLYKFFIDRCVCEERILIINYLIETYCNNPVESPFCFWRYDFPFINADHEYNQTLMGPRALTGLLYCQTEENNNYLISIMDSYFNDLCTLESYKNIPFPVIFFSMGRLYVFTIFSALLFIIIYLLFCFKMYVLVPNMYQMFFESIYNFVFNIVSEQAGILAIVHFPLVFSIFNVILCGNIVGLIPYGFTVTSHLTFTFSLGLFVFIGIVLLTILNKRLDFFRLFIPTGVPKLLVPLLCIIEVISYVFRVVSLSVRLFANMMAGHALLHILLGFVPVIFNFKNLVRFLFVFPIIIIIMITLLEIGISLLQSYVFIVLISIYLRDCYGGSAH